MKHESTVLRTLDLPGGSVMPLHSVPGEQLRILDGRVWLTEEGSPEDAFLASGEEVRLASRGVAVIEALGPTRIQLVESVGIGRFVLGAAQEVARSLKAWWTQQSAARSRRALIDKLSEGRTMVSRLETTLFFAATVSALALAAVVGIQEFSVGPTVQQAVAAPVVKLEAVQIVAERVALRADRGRRA